MNPLLIKVAPYVALAVMTFLYLGKRDDLAEAIEQCNTDKLRAIAEAESVVRNTLQDAHSREVAQREALVKSEREGRRLAELARSDAEDNALAAQETIRALMRAANEDETAPIGNVCLNIDIPPDAIDGLR